MAERWSIIPDAPMYLISDQGRMRTLTRVVPCGRKGGFRKIEAQTISPFSSGPTGYLQVCIHRRNVSVHRLVALAFCEGFFDGALVDHINGNRTDNRAENLRWVTASENVKQGYRNGRVPPPLGKFSKDNGAAVSVVAECLKTGAIKVYPAAMDAVREGFTSSQISRCCTGKAKSHKGFKWRFAGEARAS